MKNIILIIVLFLTLVFELKSQCGPLLPMSRGISNEPNFTIPKNLNEIYLDSTRLLLKIDTASFLNQNKNFKINLVAEAVYTSVYITNIKKNKNYYIGKHITEHGYAEFVSLKNSFICFEIIRNNKRIISVFDYKKSKVKKYKINGYLVGNDDTSAYFKIYETRQTRKLYQKGEVFSINENGINVVKSAKEKHSINPDSIDFYSNSFIVSKSIIEKVHSECNTYNKYLYKIYYENKLIDSFEIQLKSFYTKQLKFKIENELLIINDGERFIKKYNKKGLISSWNISEWEKEIYFLKINQKAYKEVFYSENLVFLRITLNSQRQAGQKKENNKIITLNDVPLKKQSGEYYIIMVFDIKKNKFLGYPKIEFI